MRSAVRAAVSRVTAPVVRANGKLYGWFNEQSSTLLKAQGHRLVPPGVTANGITTARTGLLVPTLFLFSNGFTVLPAACVVVNVTLDYVDGAVARWEQTRMDHDDTAKLESTRLVSSRAKRLEKTWGAYYDAIADKAFAIPVWLCMFQHFNDELLLQSALLAHIGVESLSCFVRTKAYYAEPNSLAWIVTASKPVVQSPSPPTPLGKDVAAPSAQQPPGWKVPKMPSSSVVAGITGKTKQFLCMLGTAFAMVPAVHTVGTALVVVSVPLAVGSLLQKMQSRVVYAEVQDKPLTVETLEFLEQSKALGSRLVVGVRQNEEGGEKEESAELTPMLRMLGSVDEVLVSGDLPPVRSIADDLFMKRFGIDIVAVPSSQTFDSIDADAAHFHSGRIVPVKVTPSP